MLQLCKNFLRKSQLTKRSVVSLTTRDTPSIFTQRRRKSCLQQKLWTRSERCNTNGGNQEPNTDNALAPTLLNPIENLYSLLANAPPNTPPGMLFRALLRAGKFEDETQSQEAKICAREEVELKPADWFLPDAFGFDSLPYEASNCKDDDLSEAVILLKEQIPCPILSDGDLKLVPFASRLMHSQYDLLNSDDNFRRRLARLAASLSTKDEIEDRVLLPLLRKIENVLQEETEEVDVDDMTASLLAVANLDYRLLQRRSKHRCEIPFSQNGLRGNLACIYDHAILFEPTGMGVTTDTVQVLGSSQLVAFVVEDKIDSRIDGQLAAEMVAQAAKNFHYYQFYLGSQRNFRRQLPLLMPEFVKKGDVYYAHCIKVAGTKVRVFRAEVTTQFLAYFTYGRKEAPVKKFVVREFASPSGSGFELTDLQDLRALVALLSSFYIGCEKLM